VAASRVVLWISLATALGVGCDDPAANHFHEEVASGVILELVVPVEGGFTANQEVGLSVTALFADLNAQGGVVAMDPETGQEIWRADRPFGSPKNLIHYEGRVLFAGSLGVALNAATGAELWRTDYASLTGAISSGESAMAGDRLVLGAGSEVFALHGADGRLLWRTDVGAGWEHRTVGWGVTVAGDTVYASMERYLSRTGHIGRGYLVALDAATGEILWTFMDSDGVGPRQFRAPHVAGELVLVGDNMNNAYIAVDRWTGEERWRVIGERGWFGPSKSPVVSNDTVFGGSGDRWAKAMDLYTGEVIWETHFGGSLWRGVELCGSRVLTWDTPLRVLDRATGELLESLDLYGEYGSLIRSITVDPETNQAYVLGSKHLFVFRCPS